MLAERHIEEPNVGLDFVLIRLKCLYRYGRWGLSERLRQYKANAQLAKFSEL